MPAVAVAAATAGTASGSAMLLCFLLSGRVPVKEAAAEDEREKGCAREVKKGTAMGPTEAPETWWGEVEAAAAMVRFIWSELFWKWPMMDLAFGIKYLMRRRGNLPVASVYAGRGCVQLKGHRIMAELNHMSRLMNLCIFFSKKPFRVFLKSVGYSQDDVLLQVSKAGILKPAFTILCDKSSKSFLLVIRGMHSMNDLLTAFNGAVVPFQHLFLHEGGLKKSVQGYAHCGMVAAARWIAKCATPYFLRAFSKYPDYSIKIVGNSLGGGTAALLTYILREREEFSSSTCVSFAPAACMTWEIAESGKDFITTLINGSDQVPSCSITSINYLRSEVSSSSWLSDLWAQVQHSRFLSVVNCFRSPVGTDVESKTSATVEEDVVAGLHPVPTKTWVPTKCTKVVSLKEEDTPDNCTISRKDTFSLVVERVDTGVDFECSSSSNCKDRQGEGSIVYRVTAIPTADKKTVDETTEEGNAGQSVSSDDLEMPRLYPPGSVSSDDLEMPRLYPPGKIMHMIASHDNSMGNDSIGIYRTSRHLYSKIHISKCMIKDHYMPVYKKTIELLINRLGKDEDVCTGIVM